MPVVGYDRTDSASRALAWATEETARGGKLVLVHACRSLHAAPSPLATSRERRPLGRAMIDELVLEGEDSLLDLELQDISERDPVSALIDAAKRHQARMRGDARLHCSCRRAAAENHVAHAQVSRDVGLAPRWDAGHDGHHYSRREPCVRHLSWAASLPRSY